MLSIAYAYVVFSFYIIQVEARESILSAPTQ